MNTYLTIKSKFENAKKKSPTKLENAPLITGTKTCRTAIITLRFLLPMKETNACITK